MPWRYRTPDLISYMQGGPQPTGKSDVYQLGLVFAEMFSESNSNPQKSMSREGAFSEPIELREFVVEGGMGEVIHDAIRPMLEDQPENRPTAAALLGVWQGLFLEAAKRSHALDGRVV